MTTPDTQNTQTSVALLNASRSVGAFLQRGSRSLWLSLALVVLVVTGAFLLGRSSAPASFDQQLPPHVGVPTHASLVRREDFLHEHVQNWYYAVPATSHEALTAFYRTQLSRDGWSCFRSMISLNMTRDGKTYSGTSVYMTALRGHTKAQISTADQEYGAFLLQDDLPEHAIALKISLEMTDKTNCV